MKRLSYLFVILIALGAGCVAIKPAEIGQDVPPNGQIIEELVEITGVVVEKNGTYLTIETVDGFYEEVATSESSGMPEDLTGELVKVSGTRDLSTRIVKAERVDRQSGSEIVVLSPLENATVTSPLIVQGFARIFENQFDWRIKNSRGEIVLTGFGTAHAKDVGHFGPFRLEIFLPAMTDQAFVLEVFEFSARDGSEQNLVSVPLTLLSTKTSTFNIFFNNMKISPPAECETVLSVERTVAQTSAIGRAALLELLKGPTEEEKKKGFSSEIPEGTVLNSLVISEREAKADFSREFKEVAGSCRVIAIRSQITETLMQFPTVGSVVITSEGSEAEALQP